MSGAFAPRLSQAVRLEARAGGRHGSGARNRAPLARLTIHRGSRSRLGRRFVADAGKSRDPDGRILRYVWKLNGRRLAGDRARRRVLHIRRGGVQRLTLTVTDDRGARAATLRRFVEPRLGAASA